MKRITSGTQQGVWAKDAWEDIEHRRMTDSEAEWVGTGGLMAWEKP